MIQRLGEMCKRCLFFGAYTLLGGNSGSEVQFGRKPKLPRVICPRSMKAKTFGRVSNELGGWGVRAARTPRSITKMKHTQNVCYAYVAGNRVCVTPGGKWGAFQFRSEFVCWIGNLFLRTQFGRKPKLPRGICPRSMKAKVRVMPMSLETECALPQRQMPPFAPEGLVRYTTMA